MQNKPIVTIVDAMMGTGKSTWLSKTIIANNKRTVIVLPRLTELERYEKLLAEVDGLVSLSDKGGPSKVDLFHEALMDAQVILITHSLYESYLTTDSFKLIEEGQWSLVMDEVVSIFEPVKLVTGTEIKGLQQYGVLNPVQLTEKVSKLTIDPLVVSGYLGLPPCEASKAQKDMVREAIRKDVLVIQGGDSQGFPTFTLKEERLNAFTDVTVLTYPFKDTDLDYWLQIKGYQVEHLNLTRVASTHSLSDYKLSPHTGVYSGAQFKDLIEIIDNSVRGRGKQNQYGTMRNHFSSSEYKRLTKRTGKSPEYIKQITNKLRTEFRNPRGGVRFIKPDDFMFTCPKSCKGLWQDTRNGLSPEFIGETTWVRFNERAVNDYDEIHNLAFLYNVFLFPEVKQVLQAFDLEFNEDRYALYVLIQWVWRSAIRKGENIRLYVPSSRMRKILVDWLEAPME